MNGNGHVKLIHVHFLQTDKFYNKWKDSNATLSPNDRRQFRGISRNLNTALQPGNKPIPPQDLRTVASFVEVVAE